MYKGSQSTLCGGKWAAPMGVEVDELGRPMLWPDSREGIRRTEADGEREERRRRVESYIKSSNMSLVFVTSLERPGSRGGISLGFLGLVQDTHPPLEEQVRVSKLNPTIMHVQKCSQRCTSRQLC